jgi:hypothetical protein
MNSIKFRFRYDEWIELDRVLQRQNEIDSNEEKNKMLTNDQDTGSTSISKYNFLSNQYFIFFSI